MIYRTSYNFLLLLSDSSDEAKLDSAIDAKAIAFRKLGDSTYLAFVGEHPKSCFPRMKEQFGLIGEIHWIQLPAAEITK